MSKGRKAGEFRKQVLELFRLLERLSKGNGDGTTRITTKWLSKTMEKTPVTINRYLKSLKDLGCITVVTSGPMKSPEGIYQVRTITPIKPPSLETSPKAKVNQTQFSTVDIGQPKYVWTLEQRKEDAKLRLETALSDLWQIKEEEEFLNQIKPIDKAVQQALESLPKAEIEQKMTTNLNATLERKEFLVSQVKRFLAHGAGGAAEVEFFLELSEKDGFSRAEIMATVETQNEVPQPPPLVIDPVLQQQIKQEMRDLDFAQYEYEKEKKGAELRANTERLRRDKIRQEATEINKRWQSEE